MYAEIISIGDELLIGQVINTNAAKMAQMLNGIGISVQQITVVSDDKSHIISSINEACTRADIILITGGLGPTKDDITKSTLCEYFNTTLRFDDESFNQIKKMFGSRGLPVTAVNRKQAEVPANCEVLPNPNGTAPGMWFGEQGKIFVSMPGVPYEMEAMMSDHVLPRLALKFKTPHILHKTILTQGIGESFLADMISTWEDHLPAHIKLAYLPSPGLVRLRLSGRGTEQEVLEREINKQVLDLKKIIPQYIFGTDEETLESVVGNLLQKKNATLSTAESCTGGYIAHLITSIPGSSTYFKGSVVAYANEIKINELAVKASILEKHGAVSEETVREMAKGIRQKFKTDYAIACTGIAGPSGGTADKPVGMVWIAVAGPNDIKNKMFLFGNDRSRNIRRTAVAALDMLRKEIEK